MSALLPVRTSASPRAVVGFMALSLGLALSRRGDAQTASAPPAAGTVVYELVDVLTGVTAGRFEPPTVVMEREDVSADGAELVLKVEHRVCTERYHFGWSFSRDIRVLVPGEDFEVTVLNRLEGPPKDCTSPIRDGWVTFAGSHGNNVSRLFEGTRYSYEDLDNYNTHGTTRVLEAKRGTLRGKATARVGVNKDATHRYVWFRGEIYSASDKDSGEVTFGAMYIYQRRERPPPGTDVTADGGPGPGGTGVGDGSGGVTAGGPGTDGISGDPDGEGTGAGTGAGPAGGAGPGGTADGGVAGTGGPAGGITADTGGPGPTGGGPPPTGPGSGGGPGGDGTGVGPGPAGGGPEDGTGTASPGSGVTSGPRTLVADRRDVEPGGTVSVPVSLWNPSGLANLNFEVVYDPGVVQATGVDPGNILGGALFSGNPGERGRLRVGLARTTAFPQGGIVAQITFLARGRPGQETPLTLRVTEAESPANQDLDVRQENGRVRILATGGGVLGDCDGNGVLEGPDALCALDMSTGKIPVNLRMDIDGDGRVTSSDARRILQESILRPRGGR